MPKGRRRPLTNIFPRDLLERLRRCRNVACVIGSDSEGRVISLPALLPLPKPEERPPKSA